jgi:hypothetical protein
VWRVSRGVVPWPPEAVGTACRSGGTPAFPPWCEVGAPRGWRFGCSAGGTGPATEERAIETDQGSAKPPIFRLQSRRDGHFSDGHFLDLPGAGEKDLIWRMYTGKFGLDPGQRRPPDREWTGAEIRACCRLAALLDVPLLDAAQNIVPVAVTAGESVETLRSWASGRCLAADRPGLYTRGAAAQEPTGRNVRRGPSAN